MLQHAREGVPTVIADAWWRLKLLHRLRHHRDQPLQQRYYPAAAGCPVVEQIPGLHLNYQLPVLEAGTETASVQGHRLDQAQPRLLH